MQLFLIVKMSLIIVDLLEVKMEDKKLDELVEKAKKGDKEAFSELMLLIDNDLYKIAKTRIYNEEDIKDILQETMFKAFKSIKKLKDVKKFKYWIIKILINNCNTRYKEFNNSEKLYEKINYNYKNKSTSSNEKNIEIVENTINFYQLINFLDKDEKTIILLYYNEQYTTKQIAKILKMKENTVKSKIARAKEKIKINYKEGIYNG